MRPVAVNVRQCLVREGGIEPPRAEAHKILSLVRLPISPLPHSLCPGFVTPARVQVKVLSANAAFCLLPSAFGEVRGERE